MNDDRFRAGVRREIAFVAYAQDFTVEAERKENLRGRREQRDDAHDGCNSNTIPKKAICRGNTCGEFGRRRSDSRTSSQRSFREPHRSAIAEWYRNFR